MTTEKVLSLSYTPGCLDEPLIKQIKAVIAASFNGVDADTYYQTYFDDAAISQRRLRLYFDKNTVVGYCLLTFRDVSKRQVVIGASAAFLAHHRGNNNTFAFSIVEAIKHYAKRPWRHHVYADTMLSPAMFRAVAKNIAIVYPSQTGFNPKVASLYEKLNPEGIISAGNNMRCLRKVGRHVSYSAAEISQFRASQKPEIALYCQVNPNFHQGVALVTIIPISVRQLMSTAIKLFARIFTG